MRSPRSRRELADSAPQRRHRGARPGAPPVHRGRRRRAGHAAPGLARAPVPRLRRARGPRPLGRALPPAGRRERAAQAADGRDHPLAGPGVRPDQGPARRARLPDRPAQDGEQDVTEHGRRLARLYSESDLLAAECLRHGVWRDLDPPELAAVVSALVFEARRDGPTEAAGAGRRGSATRCRRPRGCGRRSRRTSAATGWTAPGSRTPGSPGRCTGGRAASRWNRC